ncbi:hypothetical protein TrST_g10610 [Triparma strigata]|uniref:Uncharacterized protein n=1 Tax=Triparma strigata TaxID=1606541 RepID=A0A9W7AXZ5_9STRA|nr:hypothetical protein TrST_g10610 [Triparma strigata]
MFKNLAKKRKSTSANTPPPEDGPPPLSVDQTTRLENERAALTPCTIDLSSNVLNLTAESGTWELQSTESDKLRAKIVDLESQLTQKDSLISSLEKGQSSTSSLQNTSAFKSELLIDMLAVSQADNKKSEAKYEKERIKGDEWRKEVERLYKLCEEKGVDTGS